MRQTQALRAEGQTYLQIQDALGISAPTIRQFLKASGGFLRVEVTRDAESTPGADEKAATHPAEDDSGIRLLTPEGFWVEGLDVDSALGLLRGLR